MTTNELLRGTNPNFKPMLTSIKGATVKCLYTDMDMVKVAIKFEDGHVILHDTLFMDEKGSYCIARDFPSTQRVVRSTWRSLQAAELVDKIVAAGEIDMHCWNAADEHDEHIFHITQCFEG